MLRVAQHADLAGKLGRAARQRIEARFSMEQSVGRLWTIIEGVMSGNLSKPDALAAQVGVEDRWEPSRRGSGGDQCPIA
jgi:hypothetical protein